MANCRGSWVKVLGIRKSSPAKMNKNNILEKSKGLEVRARRLSSPRMLLSFATCTYSAQFINARHNNLNT